MPKHNPNWEVDPKEFEKFYDKIVKMAEEEFGVDSGGDCPIKIVMVDRSRFEPPPYIFHVPRTKITDPVDKYFLAEKAARANMFSAMETFKTLCNMTELQERELAEKNKDNGTQGEDQKESS